MNQLTPALAVGRGAVGDRAGESRDCCGRTDLRGADRPAPFSLTVDWNGYAVGENQRNKYNRKQGRAFPNPAYQAFINDLAWTIRLAAGYALKLREPRVRIFVDAPRMDVDALVKPILDAVQRSGLVDNDREVVSQSSERADIRYEWPPVKPGPHAIRLVIEGERR